MVSRQVKKNVVTTTVTTVAVNGADIVAWLNKAGFDVPKNATVQFTVPGGADWSNTAVDIDEENPVEVSWGEVRDE